MIITRTVDDDGGATHDPPIPTEERSALRGDDLEFARLEWRAVLTSQDSGLDVGVTKCDHFQADDPVVQGHRYHLTINGRRLDIGHYGYEPTWYLVVGVCIGGMAVRTP